MHAGHRAILKRLKVLSEKVNGESVLITFYPHPRKVLYPDTLGKNLKMICTQNEKIHLLQETKLDHLFIIHFTYEFSKVSAEQFVRNFLVNKLHAKVIVVGFNHHFGYDKQGDYQYLYEMKDYFGFMVEEIPQQEIDQETVSSTRIRQTPVSYTHLRAHETVLDLVCRLLLEKKKKKKQTHTKLITTTNKPSHILQPIQNSIQKFYNSLHSSTTPT